MSTQLPQGPQPNLRPPAGAADVIRTPLGAGRAGRDRFFFLLLAAWMISGLVHAALLGLFLLVTLDPAAASVATETVVINTKVDDEPVDANLTNDEIGGLDPEVPLNYNLSRIETLSVPGPVNPQEAFGIKGLPDGPPLNIPPPPGFGGNTGQGGGTDSGAFGQGNLFGTAGGMYGPQFIPGGFGGRSGATREKMVREGGGNARSEAAVAAGLKWLAQHQGPDGRWSLDGFHQHGKCNCSGRGRSNDVAATAFGLLPFLAAGETHKNSKALYQKQVRDGLKYLVNKQNKEGNFGGGMYAQGLAAIAMCEAYGLTTDPVLKSSAQRALDYIIKAQNDKGGWDYSPRGPESDTSIGGWQVMALKSGQMAGLDVPTRVLLGASKFLDANATNDGATYGYRGPGSTPTMSAVGLLCRQYLGWGPRTPGLVAGVDKLKQTPPAPSYNNIYYYYYATQVMHHMGGEAWEFWNPKMRDLLIDKQDQGSDAQRRHQTGSWSPTGVTHGEAGGRIMVTSLALLTLEVYYRHLPLYRRDLGGTKLAGREN